MEKKLKIAEGMTILSGLVIAVGPITLIRVCESGEKVMKCTYSGRMELLLGILLVVISLMEWKAEKPSIKYFVTNLLLWSYVFLIPYAVIGGCMKQEMRCQMITFPCLYLISLINSVVNIIGFILCLKDRELVKREQNK